MDAVAQLAPLLIIALFFWLLLIRPAQRRQKESLAVQRSAQPGSQIMLTSGIFGTVASTDDDSLRVEIAPGTVIKVARAAVAAVIGDPDDAANAEAADLAETDVDPAAPREQ